MDETELRTDYWIDNRSNPEFPLWVIFRLVGQQSDLFDGHPYTRLSQKSIPDILKQLENSPLVPRLAESLGILEDETRATIWYLIWLSENHPISEFWNEWNRRIDQAWQSGELKPKNM